MISTPLTSFDEIAEEPLEWLWPERIPLGELVVLDGEATVGKSALGLEIAARVSYGMRWPDGADNRRGDVLLMIGDGRESNIVKPRLVAANADDSRIHLFEEVVESSPDHPQTTRRPQLPRDLADLRKCIKKNNIRLVVIDGLTAFLEGPSLYDDEKLREVLGGMAEVARSTDCTILVIRHPHEVSASYMNYRVGGKDDDKSARHDWVTGDVSTAMWLERDPQNPARRILGVTKFNLAPIPPNLVFEFRYASAYDAARLRWENYQDLDEVDRDVSDWLVEQLALGPVAAYKLYNRAKKAGYDNDQLRRAKKNVRLRSEWGGWRVGWVWELDMGLEYEEPVWRPY